MKKVLAILLTALALSGCEQRVVTGESRETFRIVDIRQPKHFRVELQNVKTGKRQWESVSKHCNRWREVKIGSLWDIDEVQYMYPESKRYGSYLVGTHSICPGR